MLPGAMAREVADFLLDSQLAAQVCLFEGLHCSRGSGNSVETVKGIMLVAETRAVLFNQLCEEVESRFGEFPLHSAPVTHFNPAYSQMVIRNVKQ
jgi:uncharacterized protein involved in tolerance to divalent cations